ncbi:MAG: hypothetical protein JRJ59_11635 [Deltaproteobacteria bacterium]|nr:hypothetical protein [Deltaproteobacteria bacterium]
MGRCLIVGLVLGLGLVGAAQAQDSRTLTLGSLLLSSRNASWLERSEPLTQPTVLGLDQSLLLNLNSTFFDTLEPDGSKPKLLPLNEFDGLGSNPLRRRQSHLNLDRRVGQVFNVSVALSNIKAPGRSTSGGQRTMSIGSGSAGRQPRQGAGTDLWAVALEVDWWTFKRHGLHVGYLYGADPLTRELDNLRPEKQSIDLGYSYDLDGLYLNLGYVYSFSPVLSSGGDSRTTTDSTVYLRFQLHF